MSNKVKVNIAVGIGTISVKFVIKWFHRKLRICPWILVTEFMKLAWVEHSPGVMTRLKKKWPVVDIRLYLLL